MQAAPFAYIANQSSGELAVIDTATDTRIATVRVGANPTGVAVHPLAHRVYVTNQGSGTLSVIDTQTNTVVATVGVGPTPVGVAVHPAGTRLYVANNAVYPDQISGAHGNLTIVDTATYAIVANVPLYDYAYPVGVAVNPAGTRVYVATSGQLASGLVPGGPFSTGFTDTPGGVTVVDTSSKVVITNIPVGNGTSDVAVTPDGTEVYATNRIQGTVSVISTSTNSIVRTYRVGTDPVGVAVNPSGTRVYVANQVGDQLGQMLSVITRSTGSVLPVRGVLDSPNGVAVHPAGTKFYVTNRQGYVTVFDAASNSMIKTVSVGGTAIGLGRFVGTSTTSFKLPDPTAHLGVFRAGQWFQDHSGNRRWDGCGVDRCVEFGVPGDTAVAGDWTGTGTTKIGVVRDGVWLLDLNGNGQWDGCGVDACLEFSPPGRRKSRGVPVVGDWTGTGHARIGLFRDGVWFLDLNGNGRWDGCEVDACFAFGTSGDVPVVGDWNGAGRAELGVFRDGVWLRDFDGNRQWDGCEVDACGAFGLPGDLPVVGDWDGTGYARIGVLREGAWFLDVNGNGQWDGCEVDACATFGLSGDLAAVGNW